MLGSRPTDIDVRSARPADAAGLADVFARSWRGAYLGIIPQFHLDNIIRRRGKTWWSGSMRGGETPLVVEKAGEVAGYATFGAARLKGLHQGEIYELYIDPGYQGSGLGEVLFESCRARLDRRALNGLMVWALADNTLAGDFYWRRGGRPFARMREEIGGVPLEKIAYGWD